MRKHIFTILALVSILISANQIGFAQCFDCLPVALPSHVTKVDTIYLDDIIPAQKGQYYEERINFRLPQSTTPLADIQPGTPANIDINYFKLEAIHGLPPGIEYQGDRDPMKYSENAPNPRDGCISLCGTPAQSGTFEVVIDVIVDVPVLGNQSASIPVDFIVYPDSSAGFAANYSFSTCDSATVSFTNNIPSNGNNDIHYSWDFGNGTSSSQENPQSIFYPDTGTYTITQEVIIDTFSYYLREVFVEKSNCNDDTFLSNNKPDIYAIVKDSEGNQLVNNDPNLTDDVLVGGIDKAPPVSAWAGQLRLDVTKTYNAKTKDDDATSSDDNCGETGSFLATTTQFEFMDGNNKEISIRIEHYVDTVVTTEIIRIEKCLQNNLAPLEQINSSLQAYPNPSSGEVHVSFHLYGIQEEAQLVVSDFLGRELYQENLGTFEGNYQEKLNLKAFGDGVYLLQLRVGDYVTHRKIVIQ